MVVGQPSRLKPNSLGFSLIELLVAMAITSMTLMISSMGYSFFMKRWDGQLGQFDNTARFAKKLMLAEQTLSGIYPHIVHDNNGDVAIYFEGNEDGLVALTKRSLFYPEHPTAIRLSIRQDSDFKYNLVYEEAPFVDVPFVHLSQAVNFSREIVLLSGLDDIKFSYYSHANLTAKSNNRPPKWWQTHNGLARKLTPMTIRISFGFEGKVQRIDFKLSPSDTRLLNLFNENI